MFNEPGALQYSIAPATGSNAARKCWVDLTTTNRFAARSTPSSVKHSGEKTC